MSSAAAAGAHRPGHGRVVTLEPFGPDDVGTLASWLTDPGVLARTAPDWPAPITHERIHRAYFEQGGGALPFKALCEGAMVGHLGMRFIQRGVGHLYHVIVAPELHGCGYGAAMLEAASRHAFDELAAHRLQLYVFEDNVQAIACYMRVGYRVEGRHRDTYRRDEGWASTYSMALLGDDWRGSRGAAG